jgi:NADPH-dependent curcumin reductase CurA
VAKGEKKDKTLWVPKEWQDWTKEYFKEHQKELKKLGINSVNDLIWRLAELGKTDLDALIEFAHVQGITKRRHEKSE